MNAFAVLGEWMGNIWGIMAILGMLFYWGRVFYLWEDKSISPNWKMVIGWTVGGITFIVLAFWGAWVSGHYV